jgi:hypothetical protein
MHHQGRITTHSKNGIKFYGEGIWSQGWELIRESQISSMAWFISLPGVVVMSNRLSILSSSIDIEVIVNGWD